MRDSVGVGPYRPAPRPRLLSLNLRFRWFNQLGPATGVTIESADGTAGRFACRPRLALFAESSAVPAINPARKRAGRACLFRMASLGMPAGRWFQFSLVPECCRHPVTGRATTMPRCGPWTASEVSDPPSGTGPDLGKRQGSDVRFFPPGGKSLTVYRRSTYAHLMLVPARDQGHLDDVRGAEHRGVGAPGRQRSHARARERSRFDPRRAHARHLPSPAEQSAGHLPERHAHGAVRRLHALQRDGGALLPGRRSSRRTGSRTSSRLTSR